jgi:hypothetical protein
MMGKIHCLNYLPRPENCIFYSMQEGWKGIYEEQRLTRTRRVWGEERGGKIKGRDDDEEE